MSIQKVSRNSISNQVFEQMKEQLLVGEWKSGEKLPSENELAKEFGVSRVTVRNALQKLAALELVETRFGEGTFVKEAQIGNMFQKLIPVAYLQDNSFHEILQFRLVMEGRVCKLACEHATKEDVIRLEEIFRDMELYKNNLEEFARLDYAFHQQIAKATGNQIIIQMYHIVNDVMKASFRTIISQRGNTAGLHYHRLILKAIQQGDSQLAMKYMDEHMQDLYETYAASPSI